MTHRVLQILDQVVAVVEGVPAIDGRVKRSRAFPFSTDEGPAAYVRLANWTDIGDVSTSLDAEADVNILITVGSQLDDIDKALLTVDAQIHAALKVDETLGLPFVLFSRRRGFPTDENAEGELATGSAVAQWVFRFEHPETTME